MLLETKTNIQTGQESKWDWIGKIFLVNINRRDVQTKNVVNNVDMSCLRAP